MDDVLGVVDPANLDDTALIMERQRAADKGDAARVAALTAEVNRRVTALRALAGGASTPRLPWSHGGGRLGPTR